MGILDLFIQPANPDAQAQKQRREESERNLKAGGLPLNAVDRLRETAGRQGTPQHCFTSDLSASELTLVNHAGYEPLGQVMGSSVYHVGWQMQPYAWSNSMRVNGTSMELTVLTQAFYHARHLALGRLQQEAQLLGASGVVGVRLERQEFEWGAGLLEFMAIGTAIREVGAPNDDPKRRAFVSALSGQEFWALRLAGFRPVGLAVGNCSYYQVPSWNTQSITTGGFFGGSWQNAELPDYTQAVYNARELAMERMEAEAREVGATGIVGADVHVEAKPQEIELANHQHRIDMLYHFTAIGTAIAPAPAPPMKPIPMIVPLKSMKN